MSAVRQSLHADHVEANHKAAPLCASLQKESRGAYDFALLAPVDRCQRAAEIGVRPLPHLDDRQHATVQAYQIELAAFATQVAREQLEAVRLQMQSRELFRCGTLKSGIYAHL